MLGLVKSLTVSYTAINAFSGRLSVGDHQQLLLQQPDLRRSPRHRVLLSRPYPQSGPLGFVLADSLLQSREDCHCISLLLHSCQACSYPVLDSIGILVVYQDSLERSQIAVVRHFVGLIVMWT